MSRRRRGNSDSLYYYKWLDKALTDLQAARILYTWHGDFNCVAFHCQQCIEKALKGYLLFKTGTHFDGHNLTYLCRQAAKLDSQFEPFLDQTADLNNLYIESRYPTDLPFSISETQLTNLLHTSDRIFALIREDLYKGERPHKIKNTGDAKR